MATISLTRDQVAELCPECAQKMQLQRVTTLKLHVVDPSTDETPEFKFYRADGTEVKVHAGFSEGMCKKFGPDEGLFTRCAETMVGKVDDPNAFCASLHKFCVGKWPAEKALEAQTTAFEKKDKLSSVKANIRSDEAHHAEEDTDLHEYSNCIKGIEIFATGTHNGDPYTVEDLDAMVAAAKELDFRPAIKLGHTVDKPGAPAYGWVRNLRRVGEKLYADFEDMHDSVVEALRKRAYDTVSSEIYFNLKRGGKTFARALKAVALLGAEVPAVANLVPMHKMEFVESGFESIGAFEQKLDVPTEALFESLSERVAGLINLMKETDMAKNAEQIKSLKAQVAEFKHKMDEMMKKKGKMKPEDMEDDEEYKQLTAQARDISDRIAVLETEDRSAENTEVLQRQLSEAQAREKVAEADRKQLADRLARLEQADRAHKLGERVKSCRVPAYRQGLEALYAYAMDNASAVVKLFSTKDGKQTSEDKSLIDVLDGFVGQINTDTEKLFKALAFAGQTPRADGTIEENPAVEVDQRVSAYRAKHPDVKKYETALTAVLKEDAELANRYRAAFSGTAEQ